MGCSVSHDDPAAAATSGKQRQQRPGSRPASSGSSSSQWTRATATPRATSAEKTYARRQLFARTVVQPHSTSEEESKPPSVIVDDYASPASLQSVASYDVVNVTHLSSVSSNGFGSFAYADTFVDLQPPSSETSNMDSKGNAEGALAASAGLPLAGSATEKETPAVAAAPRRSSSPQATRQRMHGAQRVDLRPQSPAARADAVVSPSDLSNQPVKAAKTTQTRAPGTAAAAGTTTRRTSIEATRKTSIPPRAPSPPPTFPPGGRLSPLPVRRSPQNLDSGLDAKPKPTTTRAPASGSANQQRPSLSLEYDMHGLLNSDEGQVLRSVLAQRRASLGAMVVTSDGGSGNGNDFDSPVSISTTRRASYGSVLSPNYAKVASNGTGPFSFSRRGSESSQSSIMDRLSPALPGGFGPASPGSPREGNDHGPYSFYRDSTDQLSHTQQGAEEEESARPENDTVMQPHVNNPQSRHAVVPAKRRSTRDTTAGGATSSAGGEDSDSDSDGPRLRRQSSTESEVLVGSHMSLLEAAAATVPPKRRRMVTIVEPEARPQPATRTPVNLFLVRGLQPMPDAHQPPPPPVQQYPQQPQWQWQTVTMPQSPHSVPPIPRPAQRKLSVPASLGSSLLEASRSPDCSFPAPGRRQIVSRPHASTPQSVHRTF